MLWQMSFVAAPIFAVAIPVFFKGYILAKKFLPCPLREREEERTPFRAFPLRHKSCCEMQNKGRSNTQMIL